jgi:hypothetical protein
MSYLDADAVATRCAGARRSSGGWIARCPVHEDRAPSLSVHDGKKGTVISCHAGCRTKDIAAALGFKVAQLFLDYSKNGRPDSQADSMLRDLVKKQRATEAPRAHETLGDVMWWALNGDDDDWFRTYDEQHELMDLEFEKAYKMWHVVADTVMRTYLKPWWDAGHSTNWFEMREGAMRKLLRTWQKEKRYAAGH